MLYKLGSDFKVDQIFGWKGQNKPPKIETFGLKVCSLKPRGDPYMRPRGHPSCTDLGATRTDLEAGHDMTSRLLLICIIYNIHT